MNENPGGSPNPLNPNNNPLDANPADSTPLEEIVEEAQTVSVGPAPSPVNDPLARPMEQAPAAEPVQPKKKKTGLIIGIIIAAVVLIGGGVAAALVLMNLNKGDAVAKAIEKIVTGNAPENVAIDGTFTLTPNEESSLISNIQIDLDSQASTKSLMNSSVANVTMNFENGNSSSFEFDEAYAANGDLYFKLSGLTNAMEDYTAAMQNAMLETGVTGTDVVDCVSDGSEAGCEKVATEVTEVTDTTEPVNSSVEAETSLDTSGLLTGVLGIVENVDGEWLRISTDDLSGASGLAPEESNASCLVDLVKNVKNYNNSVAEIYGKNPFITSTTEGVTLASKGGEPVYKVTIDAEKFSAFVNEVQNSELVSNLFSCMGYENSKVNIDNVAAEINKLPTFYVEVDKDYNFTRLYFTTDLADGGMTLTADLGFTYPTNINVAEPAEYTDFSNMIQEIFTSMYALPEGETEDTVVVE